MIDSLHIRNFRGFHDLLIPQLNDFTLLGGGNNAGKSSVLEALELYHSRINPAIFIQLHALRGIPQLLVDPMLIWAPFFWKFDLNNTITIEPTFERKRTVMKLAYQGSLPPRIPPKPAIQNSGMQSITTSQTPSIVYALSCELSGENETEIQRSTFTLSNTGEIGVQVEFSRSNSPYGYMGSRAVSNAADDARRYGDLDVQNKSAPILRFLQIVEPRLKGLSTQPLGNISVIHGDIGLERKIPIYHMGDGVVRALQMILLISTVPGGLVMIDELGSGIHHSIMSRVVEAIADAAEEFKVQLIATTHSYELLEETHRGLAKKHSGGFTYIRLDRESDKVTPQIYDHEMLGIALEKAWEVR